jgi:hypothetical protein
MELVVYVMLMCMNPVVAPQVTVCHVAHVYANQADCDADAARLTRIPMNRQPPATTFKCSDPIKVKTERMPLSLTQ